MSVANVANVVRAAAETLRQAGVDTPEHDAKLLLAEAYGVELRDIDKAILIGSDISAISHGARGSSSVNLSEARVPSSGGLTEKCAPSSVVLSETPPSSSVILSEATAESKDLFATMVARRANREPLQYIVGHAPFRYLDLQVGSGVFIPRPETEIVVEEGLNWIARKGIRTPRVVDLCAGSGAIGLSVITEVTGSHVWAVEISEQAAFWARRNFAEVTKRCPALSSNYRLDIADAANPATLAELDGTIDVVITNPPYVPQTAIPKQPEVRDYDPSLALYGGSPDGARIPEGIISRAARLLRDGGLLVMEHDVTQGERLVRYARSQGFSTACTGQDLTARDRYVVAER